MALDDDGPGVAIATVSRALDIPVPTIRSWERRYGVPAPPRTDGMHRRYSRTDIDQLRQLRDLVTRGFPAREAAERVRAGGSTDGSRELLDALIASAMRLDSDGIRAVLDRAEERFGVEATLRDVALPSMREIGARWKVGACSIEQEHLATHVVRTWCSRLVALAPPPRRSDPVVLTCGPKDLHTIGLEAFGVILTRRGWSCRVLGALTPTDALLAAVRELEASAAVVTAQRGVTRRAAIESIAAVDAVSGTHAFYAGDAFAAPSARRGVPGTYLGTDIVAAADVLESTLHPSTDGR
jgi:DNA-binding transcriptional MerR regulator